MRIRTGFGMLMGVAVLLALATPAHAQGKLIKVGFSVITYGDGDTEKGVTADFGKQLKPTSNGGIDVVVEGGFHKIDAFNFVNVGGGARARMQPAGSKVTLFGQGVVGLTHDNTGFDANNPYTAFGGGALFGVNDNTSVFAQVDFFTIFYGGFSDTAPRFVFGVAFGR